MEQLNRNEEIEVGGSTTKVDHRVNPSLLTVPPAPYLKLIADCWEHIFDYLSLKDILQMGETCKRMHRMAGYYFREYFPEMRFNLIGNEVKVAYPYNFHLRTDFYPYISKLCILRRSSEFTSRLDGETFSAVKTIIFMSVQLNQIQFASTQNMLKNVEDIHIEHCDIHCGIFERFVRHCPKLKSLRAEYGNTDHADVAKSLFSQYFPALLHLKYKSNSCHTQIDELKLFLEKHTKLEQFECNMPFLWANRNLLLETNARLHLFIIDFTRNHNIPTDEFVKLLKTLYERGFYKALQLSIDRITNDIFEHANNGICTLPAFEVLDINTDETIDLSCLTDLKELHIFNWSRTDLDNLAKKLIKLEQLSFGSASVDKILPFISYSKRLKQIYIDLLENNDLDLFALNEKRKVLDGARHVTICVRENHYLTAKWISKYCNLSHVNISRTPSEYFV